jgi:predicted negative regulator of RcsB-dependent stress response
VAEYLTDQEQIDMIKQWWRDYGKFLLLAVIIGLFLGFIWRSWHAHVVKTTLQASKVYQQMLIADARMDKKSSTAYANQLIHTYEKTPYALMANFLLAKNAVQDNELGQAIANLQWVIQHARNASFRQMARIRMARILLAQQKTSLALQSLQTIDDTSFIPEINAVKGDIYMSMHDTAKAKNAYTLAQKQFSANSMEDNILQLKITQPLPQ